MKIGKYYIEGIKDRKIMFRCYLNIFDEADEKLNKQVNKVKTRIEKKLLKSGFYIRCSEVFDNECNR